MKYAIATDIGAVIQVGETPYYKFQTTNSYNPGTHQLIPTEEILLWQYDVQ